MGINQYNELFLPDLQPMVARDIQGAIDRVSLAGGTIRLPAGAIEVGDVIELEYQEQPYPHVPLPHVHIQGAGMGVTRLVGGVFTVLRSNVTISDLSIEHGSAAVLTPPNKVTRNTTLRRVSMLNSQLSLEPDRGMGGDAAVILTTIEDCLLGECPVNIVQLRPGTTTTRFVRTSFKEFTQGVLLQGAHQTVFEDCHWEGNRGRGPYLAGSDIRGLLVRRGWFEESHLAPNGESPWFVQLQSGFDAVIDARFVRKNPKGRFVCAGDVGPFYGCTVMGSGRIVGPWDGQPVVWLGAGSEPYSTSGLVLEGDDGYHTCGVKQFARG